MSLSKSHQTHLLIRKSMQPFLYFSCQSLLKFANFIMKFQILREVIQPMGRVERDAVMIQWKHWNTGLTWTDQSQACKPASRSARSTLPIVVNAGVLLELDRLPVQWVQVLVVVHQVVPELVALGCLTTNKRLVHVLNSWSKLALKTRNVLLEKHTEIFALGMVRKA